jgi:hypothetical protein
MNEELNQVNELEDEYIGSEEQMGLIAVDEELKRIQIQDNPKSIISEETKNSDFYKESMSCIDIIGTGFQKLIGYGIDYNNAVSIANNVYQNSINERLTKIQQTNVESNQI